MAILGLDGEQSFGQLKRAMQPVSSKTLMIRLRHLEAAGLIENRRTEKGRVRMSYYSLKGNEREVLAILEAFRALVRR